MKMKLKSPVVLPPRPMLVLLRLPLYLDRASKMMMTMMAGLLEVAPVRRPLEYPAFSFLCQLA